jgi:hypothetical protein
MHFLICVPAYTLTDHRTIRTALQTYGLEERLQDYKNKWHNHGFCKTDPERLEILVRRAKKCWTTEKMMGRL